MSAQPDIEAWAGTTSVPPDEETGVLLAGRAEGYTPRQVMAAGVATVSRHLGATCVWPTSAAGETAQVGCFARYELSCAGGDGAGRVAVVSEPGETVAVVVSADADAPGGPLAEGVGEGLADRGFAASGPQRWAKTVPVAGADACSRLARELLAVLTGVLGYDGRSDLQYRLERGQRTRLEPVFDRLTYRDLGRLLNAWGLSVAPAGPDSPRSYRSTSSVPFLATVQADDDEHPGEYAGFVLSVALALPPGMREAVELELREELPFARVWVDRDGDLMVGQVVYVGGGVTAAHLRRKLDFWRGAIEVTRATLQKYQEKVDHSRLN